MINKIKKIIVPFSTKTFLWQMFPWTCPVCISPMSASVASFQSTHSAQVIISVIGQNRSALKNHPPPSERHSVVQESWWEIWYPLMCFLWAPLLISMKTESHFPLRLGICTFDCCIPREANNSTVNNTSICGAVANRFNSHGLWSSCAPAQKGYRSVS